MALSSEEERRVQKRVPDNICARCRKPLQIGDRIQPVYILYSTDARNPDKITERGLELGVDSEFAHAECSDPQLDGSSASRILVSR